VAAAAATVLAIVSLVWVYAWARSNTSVADREHERLIVSAMFCLAVIGGAMALLALFGAGDAAWRRIARGAAAGAFVTIAASAASTLLIAMAIAPATDPGDFGRPLFRIGYVGALALSAAAGAAAAWAAARSTRAGEHASVLMATLVVVGGAWAYMATGSAELNKCVVDDEFPLRTDHLCSGY
jgi:hypothetical protein